MPDIPKKPRRLSKASSDMRKRGSSGPVKSIGEQSTTDTTTDDTKADDQGEERLGEMWRDHKRFFGQSDARS